MRPVRSFTLLILVALPAAAAAPRVTFERLLPAMIDLGGAEEVAVLEAAANDAEALEVFVASLVDEVGLSGTLRARDVRGRKAAAAGVGLRIESLDCRTATKEGEGGTRDAQGTRVRRRVEWVDAVCTARVAVLSPARQPMATFSVQREATSPRGEKVSDDERVIALRQAARYAALAAAERITPRRIRETIGLDETAPALEEGMALIGADRLPEARALWERTLKGNDRSAALHFNLAAICEALGDRKAAERYYSRALDLAPAEERYAREIRAFQTRAVRP